MRSPHRRPAQPRHRLTRERQATPRPLGLQIQLPETNLIPGRQNIPDDSGQRDNKFPFQLRNLASVRVIRRAWPPGQQTDDRCALALQAAGNMVLPATEAPAQVRQTPSGSVEQSPTASRTSLPDAAIFSEGSPPAEHRGGSSRPPIRGGISVPFHGFEEFS